MAVTTVVDGAYLGPPAPLDLVGRPELSMLPSIPGATLCVQYLFRDGPFGDVMHALVFEDGQLVAQHLGKLERIDAMVEVTYRAMARVRAGEITILAALEGGKVAGELGPLALLAGITESKEFHAAELATGRHAIALAALGQVWRIPNSCAGCATWKRRHAGQSRPIRREPSMKRLVGAALGEVECYCVLVSLAGTPSIGYFPHSQTYAAVERLLQYIREYRTAVRAIRTSAVRFPWIWGWRSLRTPRTLAFGDTAGQSRSLRVLPLRKPRR